MYKKCIEVLSPQVVADSTVTLWLPEAADATIERSFDALEVRSHVVSRSYVYRNRSNTLDNVNKDEQRTRQRGNSVANSRNEMERMLSLKMFEDVWSLTLSREHRTIGKLPSRHGVP